MANLIEILLKSNSGQVTTELGKVDKALDKTGKQAKTSGGMFDSLGSSIVGLAAGYLTLQTAADAIRFVINEAAEAEVVQAQLNSVLQSTHQVAGMTSESLNNLADELSQLTGVDDELILKQEAVMLTFTKVSKEVFPQAIEAALNMSAALGQDLQSSIIQVGKALNDPISGVTALRRVGVQLTDQQEEQIKNLVEQNKLFEAQGIILGELETEFGGAAEAMGDTYTGSINKLKVAIGNVAQEIGEKLIPGLADAATALELLITWKDRLTKAFVEHEIEVRKTAGSYDDYIKEMNRAAEVAGFAINAEGDLIRIYHTKLGYQQELIQSNAAMSESEYQVWYDIEQSRNILDDRRESIEANSKAFDQLAMEERWLAEQEQILKETMDELSTVMAGRLGAEMDSYAEKLIKVDERSADLREQLQETHDKIAELKEEQGEAETDEERERITKQIQEQVKKYGELNEQLDEEEASIKTIAEEHAKATRKIIFDILQQQLALDGLTQSEADALVAVAGKWGLIDKETQDAWNAIETYLGSLEGAAPTAEGVEQAINNINGGEPMVEFNQQVGDVNTSLSETETASGNVANAFVRDSNTSEKAVDGVIKKVDELQDKLYIMSRQTYNLQIQTSTAAAETHVFDVNPLYDLLGAQGVENFTVPPGYVEPYNPYTIGVSSGETVDITPAGQESMGGNIYVTINTGQINSDIDIEYLGYRVAEVIKSNQKRR